MPKATVLYHFMYPDENVSARHYDLLCEGLHKLGWEVEAAPCNRPFNESKGRHPMSESHNGIDIRRVWRPQIKQSSNSGRLLNAAWMIAAWGILIAFRRRARNSDVVIFGTDPILSIILARIIRWVRPSLKVVHWCFDMYPEAAVADGIIPQTSPAARILKALVGSGYRACDLIADIGPCMRERLEQYESKAAQSTWVPCALSEPQKPQSSDPVTRKELFGDARLGLLYSGNLGRAHSFEEFLLLGRKLQGSGVGICFGVRGNRLKDLEKALESKDGPIRIAGLAPESELEKRLASADVHLASLNEGWEGIVVPSKFFGSLAAGRPVLFAGSSKSSIARWIREFGVGWVLDGSNIDSIAEELKKLAEDTDALGKLQLHCMQVYHQQFSKQRMIQNAHESLKKLI